MKKLLKRNESGQSFVEFALILPLLLGLVCGIIDFAWFAYNQLALNNVCREVIRYAIVNTPDASVDDDDFAKVLEDWIGDPRSEAAKLEQPVRDEDDPSPLVPNIYRKREGLKKPYVDVEIEYTNEDDRLSGDLKITCEATMTILTPVLGTLRRGNALPITAELIMRVES